MRDIYFIYLAMIGFIACRSPFELDIKDSKPLVSVQAFIRPDSKLKVYINPVLAIGQESNTSILDNVKVKLDINDITYELSQVQSTEDGGIEFESSVLNIVQGSHCSLNIESKLQKTITAQTELPSSVLEIKQLDITNASLLDKTIQSLNAQLNLKVDSSTSDFWHIIFRKIPYKVDMDGKPVPDPVKIPEYLLVSQVESNAVDLYLLEHEPGILLQAKDSKIRNILLSATLKTKSEIYNDTERFKEIQLECRQVSKEYFEFHKSYYINKLRQNAHTLKNSEATVIYSNIKNAFGIFGAYSSTYKTKEFN